MDWPLRRAGIGLERAARSPRHSDEWRQTGHCAILLALISTLATIHDHSLSRRLMGALVLGYALLALIFYAESRRQRLASTPTTRARYTTVAGLTIALTTLTLAALVSSL